MGDMCGETSFGNLYFISDAIFDACKISAHTVLYVYCRISHMPLAMVI